MTTGGWLELLGPRYLGTSTVLAGGVALYATNEFLTISLLPSAVADIGGQGFYAGGTTVYRLGAGGAGATRGAGVGRGGAPGGHQYGAGGVGRGEPASAEGPPR